jgi:hypothetical protein
MAGHFPFGAKRGSRYGLAPRSTATAFFEKEGFSNALQEKYYTWWFEWAKDFVAKDSDLSATVGVRFNGFPMGQHSEHAFHLNDKYWAETLGELGSFISNLIFPKLDADAMHALEKAHSEMLEGLRAERGAHPREPAPDIGLFRHT